MAVKMSKGRSILLVITLVISNLAVMGDYVIYPIIDGLYERFGDQTRWVNLMVSIPQIMIIIFSIFGAFLLKKLSKKTLLILGGIIYCIGSIGGLIGENIIWMTVMRIPFGIGNAFVNVAAVAMILEVYIDEEKRGIVMGIYNAFQAATGAVLSVLAGYLATIHWTSVYSLFWTGIPMVILFLLFTPYIKAENNEEKEETVNTVKEPIGKKFWLIVLAFIIFALSYAVASYFVSSYVIENGIGNETTAGYLGSVGTVGSFCFCLLFGKMYAKLGKNVILPWYAANAIFMFLMWAFPNILLTYVAYFFQGACMGVSCSYTYAHVPEVVPASRADDAIGIITAAISIGYAIATYFATAMMDLLHTKLFTPVLMICGILGLIAYGIEFLARDKKHLV